MPFGKTAMAAKITPKRAAVNDIPPSQIRKSVPGFAKVYSPVDYEQHIPHDVRQNDAE